MALEKLSQSIVPLSGLGVNIDTGGLVRDITKGLKIDFARDRRKKKGITNKQINFIEIRLAPNKAELSKGNKVFNKFIKTDKHPNIFQKNIENCQKLNFGSKIEPQAAEAGLAKRNQFPFTERTLLC